MRKNRKGSQWKLVLIFIGMFIPLSMAAGEGYMGALYEHIEMTRDISELHYEYFDGSFISERFNHISVFSIGIFTLTVVIILIMIIVIILIAFFAYVLKDRGYHADGHVRPYTYERDHGSYRDFYVSLPYSRSDYFDTNLSYENRMKLERLEEAFAMGRLSKSRYERNRRAILEDITINKDDKTRAVFCPSCGGKLRGGAAFCPKCGKNLEDRK